MIQFNVQNISKYRGQLMGIATLLVIFGHSVGNGVAMPRWQCQDGWSLSVDCHP